MKSTVCKNKKLLLASGALGAGFLSGLIGAGGGIVLFFILGSLYGKDAKQNLALSSSAVMLFCIVSLFFYKGLSLDAEKLLRLAIPAALGGALGASLLKKLSTNTAKRLFAVVVTVSGIIMLVKK